MTDSSSCTNDFCDICQIQMCRFVQIAIFTDFAIQVAQTFVYNIFRAIKISKDIEKKLCICYYLSSGIVAFYTASY